MYDILLVEDEAVVANNIKNYIVNNAEYNIDIVHLGEEGLILLNQKKYHLILLDLMLPRMSGSDFLKEVRIHDSSAPVIVISALTDEFTQNDLYNLKVDDYITKPFSLKILMHKIKAIFRRVYGETTQALTYENVILIPDNYEVYNNGKEIKLTKKEFELLQLLMMNQGKVFTREQLLIQLWNYDTDATTINVHVRNIRSKFSKDIIKTIQGIGYKVGD